MEKLEDRDGIKNTPRKRWRCRADNESNRLKVDTFDRAKPRFSHRGQKRRSVSTLSISGASDRGAEWVDYVGREEEACSELGRTASLERNRKVGSPRAVRLCSLQAWR